MRYLEDEAPAAGQVANLFDEARPLMSWINLGEVFSVIQRVRGEAEAARTVDDLRRVLDVRLPDASLVLDAARIKAVHPMAYAEAFAAALAARSHGELWTGDPELLVSNARWRWRDLR